MNFIDNDELEARSKRQKRKQKRDLTWNVLTGLAVLSTIILIALMAVIFSNPAIGLNPFPPPTMPVLIKLTTPTATATVYKLPATWTPTVNPTETPDPRGATNTPVVIPSTTQAAPTFSSTYSSGQYPFELESNPIAMASTVFHPDGNCNWQGVAGRVVDMNGSPVPNIRVRLQGIYNGKTIDISTLTGLAAEWYGDSGFEFKLGDTTLDSTALLAIHLEDQSLMPISDQVIINTYTDCTKNLILVNFKQVR